MILCFSCEEQGWFVKCSDCESTEPEYTSLEILLKKTEFPVRINVFEGELEDSILFYSSETISEKLGIDAELNKKYAVTATYRINGNTYIAVDSAFPRVKFTKTECEEACYFVYDKILDLRLKYTAIGN